MKKSYHSTVVPIRLASVTSFRLRSSVTGSAAGIADLPNVPASIVSLLEYPARSRRLRSAGRRSDEIAPPRAAQRRVDHRARLVGRDAVAFERRADAKRFEPRCEMRRRARERHVEHAREHRIAVRPLPERALEHE